jgi:flagellar biogenesis protein FliO
MPGKKECAMKLFILAAASHQDPVWVYLVVLGGLALIGFFIWLLDRFFPSTKSSHASVGNALMRVEANFLPGREHIVEACERDSVEEDDQGEPPETGGC